jgi:hypothetical protein
MTVRKFRKSQAIFQYIVVQGKFVRQWHIKINFDVEGIVLKKIVFLF